MCARFGLEQKVEITVLKRARDLISLDEIDKKIIQILSKNGRIAGVELSKILGISPSTVARKIKRLEDSEVIKGYLAIIDNKVIGNIAGAVLTIKLSGGVEVSTILDDLIQNEDVCNVFETMGNYDILLTCCKQEDSQIYELIQKIRSMEGVLFVDFTSIVSQRKVLKKVL